MPTAVLDLLATTATDLLAAARRSFEGDKGAHAARRVHRAAVRDGVFEPRRHGLGPRAASRWRELAELRLPTIVERQREPTATGTLTKNAIRLRDGYTIESVQLPMGRGRTSLCVSTQVGCARACVFCATGSDGLVRNLTAGEIVGQVTLACRDQRPDNLVFMGMGEPLDNTPALLSALHVLTDRAGLAYAHDRITICTVGHVPGIAELARLGWKRLGLAMSLNAADDGKRRELMPHAARYPLGEIQRALVGYRQRQNLSLGIHWCLLPGINDSAADVAAIARFCAPLGRVLVHVIPYNPGPLAVRPPRDDEIERFVRCLRAAGIPVRRRVTKGRTVAAACGQLAGRAFGQQAGGRAT